MATEDNVPDVEDLKRAMTEGVKHTPHDDCIRVWWNPTTKMWFADCTLTHVECGKANDPLDAIADLIAQYDAQEESHAD